MTLVAETRHVGVGGAVAAGAGDGCATAVETVTVSTPAAAAAAHQRRPGTWGNQCRRSVSRRRTMRAMTRLCRHRRASAMIIVIRRRDTMEPRSRAPRSGPRHLGHVTLPAPHAFRMGGAKLHARAGPGMAGEAFPTHLQRVGNPRRRADGGAAALPGALL